MKVEQLHFLDSVSYLLIPLRKLSQAFGLSATKSWYPHFFNTKENIDYLGPIPDISYYGADALSNVERRDFLGWYETQKSEILNNRRVLEGYCQVDVTVLTQACQVFRREFIRIVQVVVFLESMTIASACNKLLRRLFLKPDTIGLIPKGVYSGNMNYSKKAFLWLIYKQQTNNCKILHNRNGREYRLPEMPRLCV
jgi:hypothetical protein